MTVKELKNRLNNYPDSMDVFIEMTNDEFNYSLVNSVKEKEVEFTEFSDGSGENCKDNVLVISDN